MNSVRAIFNMTMDELRSSDYLYSLNRMTYTAYINGDEFEDVANDDGWVVVIYNPVTKEPIVISIFGALDDSGYMQLDGFIVTYKDKKSKTITLVRKGFT